MFHIVFESFVLLFSFFAFKHNVMFRTEFRLALKVIGSVLSLIICLFLFVFLPLGPINDLLKAFILGEVFGVFNFEVLHFLLIPFFVLQT